MAKLGDIGKLGLGGSRYHGASPARTLRQDGPKAHGHLSRSLESQRQEGNPRGVRPDSQLRVRQGMEAKAAEVWATASRAHLNRDFTFGSQALAVAYTDRESMGGRVWPNVTFPDKRLDHAFTMWGNSTLGLLSYWWHSSRQQSSKAGMTIRSAEPLPVLDFRALTDEQLHTAEAIFNEFRDKELKPAYLADADANRALLDKRVVCDLLGFDENVYVAVRHLAAKWCAEPSVQWRKGAPKGCSARNLTSALYCRTAKGRSPSH